MNDRKEKLTIGWQEKVDLPDLDVWGLQAKIDTGARTSSLHVDNISVPAKDRVRFQIVLDENLNEKSRMLTEKISRISLVRTNPQSIDNRYYIRTTLKLGSIIREIELNLTCRQDMRFRMILGRTALKKDFLINVNKCNLLNRQI